MARPGHYTGHHKGGYMDVNFDNMRRIMVNSHNKLVDTINMKTQSDGWLSDIHISEIKEYIDETSFCLSVLSSISMDSDKHFNDLTGKINVRHLKEMEE